MNNLDLSPRPFHSGAAFLFVQHERVLTGESPQRAFIAGSVQPEARVSVARQNLKEARVVSYRALQPCGLVSVREGCR